MSNPLYPLIFRVTRESVVNVISVLIMSLNNSIKASEKCDLFRRLGQQFLLLADR